jgi:hypothetical protein
MIMEMLRTNDAICYAYLNDECIKHTSPPETTPGSSRNCAEDLITTSIYTLLGKDKLRWG